MGHTSARYGAAFIAAFFWTTFFWAAILWQRPAIATVECMTAAAAAGGVRTGHFTVSREAGFYRITPAPGFRFEGKRLVRLDGHDAYAAFEYDSVLAMADGGKQEAYLAKFGIVLERVDGRITGIRFPLEGELNRALDRLHTNRDADATAVRFVSDGTTAGVVPALRFAELWADGRIPLASDSGREWLHDRLLHVPQYLLLCQFPEFAAAHQRAVRALVTAYRRSPTPDALRRIEHAISTLDTDGFQVIYAANQPGRDREDSLWSMSTSIHRVLGSVGAYDHRPPSEAEAISQRIATQIYNRLR